MLRSQNPAGDKRPRGARPPRPTTARANHAGLVISLGFHALILAATWFTWNKVTEMSPATHAVPVELVVAEQTNVRAEAPPPEPDQLVKPDTAIEQPPLPEFVDVEPAPVPPVPQFQIVKPKTTDTPQPEPPKTKKQIVQDADAVLNKILAQAAPPKNAKAGPRVIQGAGNQSLATADLADSLKSQIYGCWTPPTGAPNAADLVVDFNLSLNQDGTVMGRPQLSGNSANAMGNPYTRAAAEAASRAIYQCAPYKLPAARYNEWRQINPLRFDPRQMMGQ